MTSDAVPGPDLLVYAGRAAISDDLVPALVAVSGGKISGVYDPSHDANLPRPRDAQVIRLADDELLLPGLVDTHVHVNEPGRTEWEGFATATAAAAAGGITTIVDMPLNSLPPTTDVAALKLKRAEAGGQCRVDVGFWGGAVPGNESARRGLHEAGVLGFKSFTVDSGVPEFPPLDAAGLELAARQLAALGSLLLVHAEDAGCIAHAQNSGGCDYGRFLQSRPDAAETAAIATVIEIVRRTGVRAHVLHVSSADAVPLLAAARAEGLSVTAETCPHYLALAAEDVPDGATQFKCCPPIRGARNRERLWEGLRAGVLDCIVSDHSPCPPAMKQLDSGDFGAAWGGISSVQLALPVVWSFGRERGCSMADVVRWMAASPAKIAGLPAKGRIAVGYDADLVAFAPDEAFVVDPAKLLHRHKLTPYAGQRLTGVVRRTWLRGREVFGREVFGPSVPHGEALGRLLTRDAASVGAS